MSSCPGTARGKIPKIILFVLYPDNALEGLGGSNTPEEYQRLAD